MSLSIILLFGTLFLFMFLSVPIAISLGLSSVIVMYYNDIELVMLAQNFIAGANSFPLLAIPFFMLAGSVMSTGGVSVRIVNFAKTVVGSLPGGLAQVSLLGSLFFSALSGSSSATAAAVGGIMIPSMNDSGYPKRYSAAVVGAGAALGPIIPPSILLILYGVIAGQSIGTLFLATIGPGLLIYFMFVIYVYFLSKKKGITGDKRYTFREIVSSFKKGFFGLMMPVLILGGIYGGFFTPTEAAAVGAFYGFVISLFVYRELKFRDIGKVLLDAAKSTGMVMIILMSANFFGWILVYNDIPQTVTQSLSYISTNPTIILLIITGILLIIGTFMNAQPALLIMAPILFPLSETLDIDPIFFGVVLVLGLVVGVITPPVGVDLFITSAIAGISIESLAKAIFPYIVIMIIAIIIVILVPSISMFLPNLVDI